MPPRFVRSREAAVGARLVGVDLRVLGGAFPHELPERQAIGAFDHGGRHLTGRAVLDAGDGRPSGRSRRRCPMSKILE